MYSPSISSDLDSKSKVVMSNRGSLGQFGQFSALRATQPGSRKSAMFCRHVQSKANAGAPGHILDTLHLQQRYSKAYQADVVTKRT